MSLDVYLYSSDGRSRTRETSGSGIFIRENGSTREISHEEWDQKFPGCEPVVLKYESSRGEIYSANITHNLTQMAGAAGLYACMWRPDEHGFAMASQLIEPLKAGLERLRAEPEKFKVYNPSNGWGSYEGLVSFVSAYLEACERCPDAYVRVSR